MPPRLTELARSAGGAANLRPADLAELLRQLKPAKPHPNALVGFETSDDAAVYRLTRDLAIVESTDSFAPVVDDPYTFGRIAAAHALSDLWAMGAKAIFALNLVGWPKALPLTDLAKMLKGGHAIAHEAGIPILGGHTVQDDEPRYGLAVTGTVHPKRVLRNVGARDGDVLFLTKPLGSGIATTAIKRGKATRKLVQNAVGLMTALNKDAGEVFASGKFKVNALTDVTGSGLLGHLWKMMSGSRLRARLYLERVPILEGIPKLAAADVVSDGTRANLEWVKSNVQFPEGLPLDIQYVLADAQINGGLLASVPWLHAKNAMAALNRRGVGAAPIGEVFKGPAGIDVE